MPTSSEPCPCGSGASFDACCGPLLAGAPAPTAESLMRSRYTAHVVGDHAHLARTWHAEHRPPVVRADPSVGWAGLEILATDRGRQLDAEGTVTFVARHGRGEIREHSRFARVGGVWVYLDGERLV